MCFGILLGLGNGRSLLVVAGCGRLYQSPGQTLGRREGWWAARSGWRLLAPAVGRRLRRDASVLLQPQMHHFCPARVTQRTRQAHRPGNAQQHLAGGMAAPELFIDGQPPLVACDARHSLGTRVRARRGAMADASVWTGGSWRVDETYVKVKGRWICTCTALLMPAGRPSTSCSAPSAMQPQPAAKLCNKSTFCPIDCKERGLSRQRRCLIRHQSSGCAAMPCLRSLA
ncbi:hypothetical protein SAMN02982917_6649 [Azospirillum oryzae]|uniref:Uncharacterized protein n=1 Tax=Azospirillum oryzae TaxID=286727 RepID=A0A1X7HNQ5_9PROT|nr:hypothetical protein SAMN02982917_6649 [Azospirillum oryzae]